MQEGEEMRWSMIRHKGKDEGTGEERSSRKINLDMLHQGLPGRRETEHWKGQQNAIDRFPYGPRDYHPSGIKDIIVKTTNEKQEKKYKARGPPTPTTPRPSILDKDRERKVVKHEMRAFSFSSNDQVCCGHHQQTCWKCLRP